MTTERLSVFDVIATHGHVFHLDIKKISTSPKKNYVGLSLCMGCITVPPKYLNTTTHKSNEEINFFFSFVFLFICFTLCFYFCWNRYSLPDVNFLMQNINKVKMVA